MNKINLSVATITTKSITSNFLNTKEIKYFLELMHVANIYFFLSDIIKDSLNFRSDFGFNVN